MKKLLICLLSLLIFTSIQATNKGEKEESLSVTAVTDETVTITVPYQGLVGAYLELTYGANGKTYGISAENFSSPVYHIIPVGRYTVARVSIADCDSGTRSATFYSGSLITKLYVGDIITITQGGTIIFNCN